MKHETYTPCAHGNSRNTCLVCFAAQGQPHRHTPRLVEAPVTPLEAPQYVPNTIIEDDDAEGNKVLLCAHMVPLFAPCLRCRKTENPAG